MKLWQRWQTKRDEDGNPRNLCVVWTNQGHGSTLLVVHKYGYTDPTKDYCPEGSLGEVEVTPAEYRSMLKRAKSRGILETHV